MSVVTGAWEFGVLFGRSSPVFTPSLICGVAKDSDSMSPLNLVFAPHQHQNLIPHHDLPKRRSYIQGMPRVVLPTGRHDWGLLGESSMYQYAGHRYGLRGGGCRSMCLKRDHLASFTIFFSSPDLDQSFLSNCRTLKDCDHACHLCQSAEAGCKQS